MTADLVYRSLLPKWALSFALFYIIWRLHTLILFDNHGYRPSGHLLCALVSYSNWLNLVCTLEDYDFPKINLMFYMVLNVIAAAFTIYQLAAMYFTAFVFHHHSEMLLGFINGCIVSYVVFGFDEISSALYDTFLIVLPG